MTDLVSVIIPTYNRASLLQRAVNSALGQSYQPVEVIVIDDGSTDETQEILSLYNERITVIRQENQGVSSARNAGLRHAHGEYIAFLDSDDFWARDKLLYQVNDLHIRQDVGVSYTWYVMVGESGKLLRAFQPSFDGDVFTSLYLNNFLVTPHILARRECFSCGTPSELVFDTDLAYGEDWKLWMQLALRYKFSYVPQFLVGVTDHPKRVYKTGQVERILQDTARIDDYFWHDELAASKLSVLGSRAKAMMAMRKGYIWFLKEDKNRAFKEFRHALHIDPTLLLIYVSMLQTVLGRAPIDRTITFLDNLRHPDLRDTKALFPNMTV